MPLILTASGVAFFLSCLFMPRAEQLARTRGFTTSPAANKSDQRRLPYLGGVALFFVLLTALSLALWSDRFQHVPLRTMLFLLAAAGWTVAFGLYDDVRELSPRCKFMAQLASAGIIIAGGIRTEIFFLSPPANMLLTAFWIVALMNAINLLDIMDGLAGSLTLINGIFFLLFGWLSHNFMVMLVSAVLIVSLIPFLRRNLPPARLVMGDAGSQLLGLCQAVMALTLDMASAGHQARLVIPVMILALPLFDLLFVIVMRAKQGRSIFLKSDDHFVFRMRSAGMSDAAILRRMLAMSVLTNGVAVLIFHFPLAQGVVLCVVCSAALLAAGAQAGNLGVGR